jgi:regulator of RNase E activity RraA
MAPVDCSDKEAALPIDDFSRTDAGILKDIEKLGTKRPTARASAPAACYGLPQVVADVPGRPAPSTSKAPAMSGSEPLQIIRQRLFTAVIGDVMDAAGLTRQFLPPEIRALQPDTGLVGRAMTVLEADIATNAAANADPSDAFGLMFRALDDLKPGEVYICTGASPRYALWGGLMSTRAARLGAVGAVLDGYHRDTREILSLGFPVFSAGAYAQDQRLRGRVVDFRTPITFPNGCRVAPGDVIVGDIDGVLAIPAGHLADIVTAALAKVDGEESVRRMIIEGTKTEDAFNQTGIM